MKMTKRYYWLKLKEDFFEEDTIEWLEEQENGKEYCLFYLKMCLKSIKTEGILIRKVGNILVPYDEKHLAKITNTDFDTVVVAMELFKKIGLIQILEGGEIFIPGMDEMIGSETEKAKFMRNKRAKEKEQLLDSNRIEQSSNNVTQNSNKVTIDSNNVTNVLPKCYTEKEKEKEKEIEIDIELDSKVEDTQSNKQTDIAEFSKLYEQNIGTINQLTADWLIEMSETIDFDLFKRGIEICTERGKLNLGYLKGIIKRWLDSNITTYEQLKAYELQMKANKNSDNKNYDIAKEKEKPSVVQLQPLDFSEVRKELEEMGIEL
ncbi:MAG: phage replisome organizer N-terminal domain-containing protein [Clostridium sp.]|nr:phage replisome organizer N-terminal domain-containing protein [Clostridium sp.]